MKRLLLPLLILALVSCTEEKKDEPQREAPVEQQQQKSAPIPAPSEAAPAPVVDETPPEPTEHEETTYAIEAPVRDVCKTSEVEACGMRLEECTTGKQYYCMHNVSLIVSTKMVRDN